LAVRTSYRLYVDSEQEASEASEHREPLFLVIDWHNEGTERLEVWLEITNGDPDWAQMLPVLKLNREEAEELSAILHRVLGVDTPEDEMVLMDS
jgi:hypothetical protein